MIKACQSYVGHGICYDGFPEKPSCRNGEGTPPHCLNPDFFTNHLHTEDAAEVESYIRIDKMMKLTSKYMEYGEYITVEFDDENSTARVVPNNE